MVRSLELISEESVHNNSDLEDYRYSDEWLVLLLNLWSISFLLARRINTHIHNHTWMILNSRYKISIVHARFIINDNWSNNPSILNENPILCSTSQSQYTLKRLKFPFQKHIFIQIFVCWCVHVVYCGFNLFSNSFNSINDIYTFVQRVWKRIVVFDSNYSP